MCDDFNPFLKIYVEIKQNIIEIVEGDNETDSTHVYFLNGIVFI